jgi:hypothetical protein
MTRKDYRVYGDMIHKYYLDISAESPELAWEGARLVPTNEWNEITIDSIVDPYNVVDLENITK